MGGHPFGQIPCCAHGLWTHFKTLHSSLYSTAQDKWLYTATTQYEWELCEKPKSGTFNVHTFHEVHGRGEDAVW